VNWWRRLFQRRLLDEQLDREIEDHLVRRTADLVAEGVDPGEATHRARLEFGMREAPVGLKISCRTVVTACAYCIVVPDSRCSRC